MDAKKQAGVIERRAREGSSRAQYLLAAGHAGKLTNLHLEEIETLLQQEIGDGVAEVACRWEDVAAAWTEDGESAFRWARKAAAGGIPPTQRLLGALYRVGIGTKPDAAACFRWTECAALNGDIRAQVNLAQFHENGEGTPCDDAKAEEWYSRVANRSTGVLDEAAESRALLGLARLSRDGKRRAGDAAFQARMYRKAAEMGDPEGQGRYALALAHGEGVDQDLAEAARWYRRSAEGGNVISQNNLAGMYADGEGVEVDETEAVRWYKKAAAAGQREAEYNLAQRYAEGRGVEKDEARGVALLRRAADKGMLDAQFDLGQMLWQKPASGRDLMDAVTRLAIAAEQGHVGARLALHDIAGVDVSPDDQIREFGFVRVHPTGKTIGGHPVYRDAKRGPQRRGSHGRQAHALAGCGTWGTCTRMAPGLRQTRHRRSHVGMKPRCTGIQSRWSTSPTPTRRDGAWSATSLRPSSSTKLRHPTANPRRSGACWISMSLWSHARTRRSRIASSGSPWKATQTNNS